MSVTADARIKRQRKKAEGTRTIVFESFELKLQIFESIRIAGSLNTVPGRPGSASSTRRFAKTPMWWSTYATSPSIRTRFVLTSNPKAVCQVDPCGGCRHAFYAPSTGRKVDYETEPRSSKLLVRPVDAGLLGENEFEETISQRFVPALRDAIKPGFCPPARSRTYLRVLAQFARGSCADQCVSDADCADPLLPG